MTQGAEPLSEQRSLFSLIVVRQQSAPERPGMFPQETPPHTPHAATQQMSSVSTPGKPLLQTESAMTEVE